MKRNLDPEIIAFNERLTRGAIVVLPARGSKDKIRLLRFQYNPETISRSRQGQWETRKKQKFSSQTPQERSLRDAHRGGGLFAKSESISLKLVFDSEELSMRDPGAADDGVLPELALLESIALAKANRNKRKNKKKSKKLISLAPSELLLILGPRRFPVVITSLTITEQRFNPKLVPIRAECDLKLRVLEATEVAGNSTVSKAYTHLLAERDKAAKKGSWAAESNFTAIEKALADTVKAPKKGDET